MLPVEEMTQYVDENIKSTLDNLFRLVKIPTVTAKDKDREYSALAIKELQKMFETMNFKTDIIETKGQPVFIAHYDADKPNTLLFYDHYDVQPAEPFDSWDNPPFEPEIKDNIIFGRGVADNKGEIIVRASAVELLQKLRGDLPVNIKFIIEGEEEVSSPNLASFVKENLDFVKGKENTRCIWEFGGKNASGVQELWAGVKGICYVQLRTTGPTNDLHSALGAIVENPANHLVAALASLRDDKNDRILLKDYYKTIIKPNDELLKEITNVANSFDENRHKDAWGVKQFINELSGTDLLKKYYLSPTCTICGIWAGWQEEGLKTVLPATAHAKLDFRLVPNQTPEDVINKLRNHFSENNFNIEIEWYKGYRPAYTPLTDPFVQVVKQSMREVYNQDPIIHPWNAGSGPMYLFADHIPVLSIGVGHTGSNAHSPNENIFMDDFKQGQILIARLMENME